MISAIVSASCRFFAFLKKPGVGLSLLFLCCGWQLAGPLGANAAPPLAGKLIYFQGQVAVARGGNQKWHKAKINQDLFVGDAVQTGPNSRAAILCADESQVKLNENTLLILKSVVPSPRLGMAAVVPAAATGPPGSLYQVPKGEIWLRNNKEKFPFAVQTPAVTAAIRGTEFNLRVRPDGVSYITLLGGSLHLFNDYGHLMLKPGEEGVTYPGQAPTKRIIVQPTDAVQWSLYYPGIFSFKDLPLAPSRGAVAPATGPRAAANLVLYQAEQSYDQGRLREAQAEAKAALKLDATNSGALTVLGWLSLQQQEPKIAAEYFRLARHPNEHTVVGLALARYRMGNVTGAYRLIQEAYRSHKGSPLLATMYGYMALGVGRVGEATATFKQVLQIWPQNTLARCLLAQIYLVQNHKDLARTTAAQALAQASDSPLAHLTTALVDISFFNLPAASRHLHEALTTDPRFVTAYVYLAKIQLGGDYLNRAWDTVQRALALAPREAEVLTLAGFVRLAFRDYGAAKQFFDRAVAANPGLGEPHLGLGIYAFRYREMDQGLFQMLAATLLEPRISLYQSELGKALYQVRAFDKALEVFNYAKTLDKNDPTPYLYEGIALTDLNRPAEAVQQINRSIALNGNKAIFRSRLMLDQDLAVKNYNLARAYTELGLADWAYSKAVTAVNKAPTNSSAYYFLSESYSATRQRFGSGTSALLLYRLLSPANQNTFSLFNDYTPMFEMPYLRTLVQGSIGSWQEKNAITNDSLDVYGGLPGWAFDVAGFYNEDQGFRQRNGDDKNYSFIGLFKGEPTVHHSILGSFSYFDAERGDNRNLNDYGYANDPYWRQYSHYRTYELGYVYRFNPNATFLSYFNYSSQDNNTNDFNYGSGTVPFTFPPFQVIPGVYKTDSGYDTYDFKDYILESTPHEFYNLQLQQQLVLQNHTLFGGFDYFTGHLKYRYNEQLDYLYKTYYNLYSTFTFPANPNLNFTIANPYTLPLNISATGTVNQNYRPPERNYSFYLLDYWKALPSLLIQMGVLKDYADSSRAGFANPIYNNKWGGLLGINWQINAKHTLRLALQSHLNTHYFTSASLIPPQIASFPWQINVDNGSQVREIGLDWEAQWNPKTFSVLRLDAHRISVPLYWEAANGSEPRIYWMWKRYLASLTLNRILGRYFGLSLGAVVKKIDPSFPGGYDYKEYDGLGQLVFWHPSGFRASINSLLVKQDLTNRGDNLYGIVNAMVGYEFPGKRGLATLEIDNLLNRHFYYQQEFVTLESFYPARRIMFTLALYF